MLGSAGKMVGVRVFVGRVFAGRMATGGVKVGVGIAGLDMYGGSL